MGRLGYLGGLLCAGLLVLSSDLARAQQPKASQPSKPAYVSLPLQAVADVKERYVRRLERALDGLERPNHVGAVGREFRFPERGGDAPCAQAACLSEVAQGIGSPGLMAWVLEADGYDFVLRMIRFRSGAPEQITEQRFPISHHDLARDGRRLVEQQWSLAAQDVRATAEGSKDSAAVSDRPAPSAERAPETGSPASDEDETPREPDDGASESEPGSSEKVQPSGRALSVKQVAARMGAGRTPSADAEEEGGGLFGGARGEDSSEDEKKTKEDWEAYWAKRKAAYAGATEDPAERRARQIGLLTMGLAGLAAASVGFFLGNQLNFRIRRRRKVSFEAQVGAKEAAMTMATLRECARQLTPGVLMAPEFETSKRFCFALVDGKQVSVDVMQLTDAERAAFRVGMQLCAQFVHKGGTAMCMMSVLRLQKVTASRLRLVLTAPERLAEVTRPKGFKIPVDRTTPLLARALRASDTGTQQWQALVSVVSDSTLEIALDDDAFAMAEGDRIDLKLRIDDIQADVVGQVVQLSSGSVHFELEDKHGGLPPREYQNLVRKLEGHWLSTLGS